MCGSQGANDKTVVGAGVWVSSTVTAAATQETGSKSPRSPHPSFLFHPLDPQKQANANVLSLNLLSAFNTQLCVGTDAVAIVDQK